MSEEQAVAVRPIEPDDAARLSRMFKRLSPETVYRRFFSPIAEPRPSVLRHLATVDHDERDALVAVVEDEIVAVARYDRHRPGSTDAEIAVVVEDAWQRHHLASALLRDLARLAVTRGIRRFTATALSDNSPVLELMRRTNPAVRMHFDGGEVVAVLPLG